MSQYGYLSTPDPEFAALLQSMPSEAAAPDMKVEDMRAGLREAIAENQKFWEPHLPLGESYTVQDHHVAVDGGEIIVRSLIPKPSNSGETFPVLVWFHGGGWMMGIRTMDDYHL